MCSTFYSILNELTGQWGSGTHIKSVNLPYNTLVRWADGTNDLPTKRLMFQVFFFKQNLAKFFAKTLLIFFSYKITSMKIKSFECTNSIRNYEKRKTWNVRRLVDESFVPPAPQTSVLYCRLLDLQSSSIKSFFVPTLSCAFCKTFLNLFQQDKKVFFSLVEDYFPC